MTQETDDSLPDAAETGPFHPTGRTHSLPRSGSTISNPGVLGALAVGPSLSGLRLLAVALGLAASFVLLLFGRSAQADESVIKYPGAHPDYVFEAEPHLVVAPFDKPLLGVGFRGTIELVDNGFVRTINNTVGLGLGIDWTRDRLRLPVVMQWNFWLSRNWSVFGEPGGLVEVRDHRFRPRPAFYAGGRLHFTDDLSLTMRVGHPTASVGLSWLL